MVQGKCRGYTSSALLLEGRAMEHVEKHGKYVYSRGLCLTRICGMRPPLVPVGDVEALAGAMAATLDGHLPPETLWAAVAEYNQNESAGKYLDALRAAAVSS